MSFAKIAVLIITFNFLRFCVLAEYERFRVIQKRGDEIRACGASLTEILATTCGGIYNRKRADNSLDNGMLDSDNYNSHEADSELIAGSYPLFRSKRSVSSILRSSLKRSRGAADECCAKWCKMSELAGYCG